MTRFSEVFYGNHVSDGDPSSPEVNSGNSIIDNALPSPQAAQLQVFAPPPILDFAGGLLERTNISSVLPGVGFVVGFSGLESFSNEGRDSDSNDSFAADDTIVDLGVLATEKVDLASDSINAPSKENSPDKVIPNYAWDSGVKRGKKDFDGVESASLVFIVSATQGG